jgi:hypothetical protein
VAIYHLHANIGSKAKLQSAVAKVAYVTRSGKYDGDLDQLLHVEHNHFPKCADSPDAFWRAVDQFERANGRLFYEVEVALPAELNLDAQRQLAHDFAEYLSSKMPSKDNARVDHGQLPYSMAIHKGHDERNPHAHIVLHERAQDDTKTSLEHYFARATPKQPELGGVQKSLAFDGKQALLDVRAEWELKVNIALERAGVSQRVDCRSFEDRGIEREPQIHLGHNVTALERAGFQTQRGDELRAIIERNAQRDLANELQAQTKRDYLEQRSQHLEPSSRTPHSAQRLDPEPRRAAPQRADGRADLADTLPQDLHRRLDQDRSTDHPQREDARTGARSSSEQALHLEQRTQRPDRDEQARALQVTRQTQQIIGPEREPEQTIPLASDHTRQLEADRLRHLERHLDPVDSVRPDVLLHPKDELSLRHDDQREFSDHRHGSQARQDLAQLSSQPPQGASRSPLLDDPGQPPSEQSPPVPDHAAAEQRRLELQRQLDAQQLHRQEQQKERETKAVDYHVQRAHELAKRDGFKLATGFEGSVAKCIDTNGHKIFVIEDAERKLYAVAVDPKHVSVEAALDSEKKPRLTAKQQDHSPSLDDRVYVVSRADQVELASGYPEAKRNLERLEKEQEKQKAKSRGSDFEM